MSKVTRCPCCGQRVPEVDRLLVDLDSNTVMFNGVTARVRPLMASLIYIVAQAYPDTVPRERLIVGVWGKRDDVNVDNLRSLISETRLVLKQFGVSLLVFYKTGYRLAMTRVRA